MIDRSRPANPMLAALCADAGTAAAILMHEDARQSKQMNRTLRREAQHDRIELMKQAADKLREAAGDALWSGIVKGALGLAAAAAKWKKKEALYRAFDAGSAVDTFGALQQRASVEKQELETRAEVAGNQAQEHGEDESEATRRMASAVEQLRGCLDAQQRVAAAALRV